MIDRRRRLQTVDLLRRPATSNAAAKSYDSSNLIFAGLLGEVRELSRKKPEATLSASKVKIINRVLADLLGFLGDEAEGKYLESLDDESLPQVSDAVLVMVQFDAALKAFKNRYYRNLGQGLRWITHEYIARLSEKEKKELFGDEGETE